jgi:hypothetical protein
MYENIIIWARVLRICLLGILIYIILRELCLINEWNAIINLQNDIVKNIQNQNKKKI